MCWGEGASFVRSRALSLVLFLFFSGNDGSLGGKDGQSVSTDRRLTDELAEARIQVRLVRKAAHRSRFARLCCQVGSRDSHAGRGFTGRSW